MFTHSLYQSTAMERRSLAWLYHHRSAIWHSGNHLQGDNLFHVFYIIFYNNEQVGTEKDLSHLDTSLKEQFAEKHIPEKVKLTSLKKLVPTSFSLDSGELQPLSSPGWPSPICSLSFKVKWPWPWSVPDLIVYFFREGGRLVYWLPVIRQVYSSGLTPSHPCLRLVEDCEQVSNPNDQLVCDTSSGVE